MNRPLVIILSTLLSVILTISTFPLGSNSPEWIILIIMYWIIAVPGMYNLYVVWLIGIIKDVTVSSVLGMNAFIYVLLAYSIKKLHKSLRYFTIIQQSIIVFFVLIIEITVLLWFDALLDSDIFSSDLYWSSVTSALSWPIIFLSLRYLRRKYNISW